MPSPLGSLQAGLAVTLTAAVAFAPWGTAEAISIGAVATLAVAAYATLCRVLLSKAASRAAGWVAYLLVGVVGAALVGVLWALTEFSPEGEFLPPLLLTLHGASMCAGALFQLPLPRRRFRLVVLAVCTALAAGVVAVRVSI